MIFYRLIPVAALLLLALWIDARNKSEAAKAEAEETDPNADIEPEAKDTPQTPPPPPPKPKAKAKAKATVKVEPAPADAPKLSKPLQKAIDKLSAEQAKAFLSLINSKTAKPMQNIPGVGASMAGKIQKGRPYKSAADLLDVSGIGERRLIEFLEWAREQ